VRSSSDPQDAGPAVAKRAAGGEHRLCLGQQSTAVTKKFFPFARQQESAAPIVEQPETQLVLQRFNPARQRRLSDAQLGCGSRYRAAFADRDKRLKVFEVHHAYAQFSSTCIILCIGRRKSNPANVGCVPA
jgi:hypothetical protein